MSSEPIAETDQRSPLRLLRNLILVREFELTCERLWREGVPLVGEFHLSLGQEAIAVGTCAAVRSTDPVCPSIRGMGVYLCRGASMTKLMASFFDNEDSISRGRWPHWHSAVPDLEILPQTGMLGSGLATAVGVAFAEKHKGTGTVTVAMLGDGTTNTGYFHESVNIAAVKQLPIVVVIENNQIAVSTPIAATARVSRLSTRAGGYGIPGTTVDGNDVRAVLEVIDRYATRAREGGGPAVVECLTYRWGGQTLRDPDKIRPPGEKQAARANCPVQRFKKRLLDEGAIDEGGFELMVADVRRTIDTAQSSARGLPSLEERVRKFGIDAMERLQ